LLAVVAGYSLLLLLNQQLTRLQRQAVHESQVERIAASLQLQVSSGGLRVLSALTLPAGWQLRSASSGVVAAAPELVSSGEQVWLVSRLDLAVADDQPLPLLLEQNVTTSVQQERLAFWLLVVAAGISSLFTSALMRLVLRRGLVRPLEEFTAQLLATQVPPALGDQIAVARQPEELQPIALAFNDLQQRLHSSWERERAFVDGAAHELRTPITLISGYAQRLLRQPQLPAQTPSLSQIHDEAQHMALLVSDLLDLARQDAGRLHLQCQPLLADDILLPLYERLGPRAGGRLRLQLADETAAPLPLGLADPERLQQCLTALVENALAYAPAPTPVQLAAGASGDGSLVLHVIDHGPGVEPGERQAIFGRFVRGSAATSSGARGSGIGLAVVQLLMQAMGGSVAVAEAPGGGADFQLWLAPLNTSGRRP
jgi:signal transduction histidine kinase